ncbi:MAG: 50S ribosomal protein L4 [Candidatus Margulisbacteria bacterium]|nr:50S ribosomal protein L4 [Candidatus Margulisiibacteriota bacterium]
MTKLALYDIAGKSLGEVSAPEDIFGHEINEAVVHSALVWYLAAKRRGTHSTLTKAEVSGGGKKPWKQKGTGRARAGSIRSPLWRKGGVIFGPKPRSYNYNLPQKIRKKALKVALSDKVSQGKLIIVDDLKLAEQKTKLAAQALAGLKLKGKIVVVLDDKNEIFMKSARNIRGVNPVYVNNLNIFDVLYAEAVVIEKAVINRLKERLA